MLFTIQEPKLQADKTGKKNVQAEITDEEIYEEFIAQNESTQSETYELFDDFIFGNNLEEAEITDEEIYEEFIAQNESTQSESNTLSDDDIFDKLMSNKISEDELLLYHSYTKYTFQEEELFYKDIQTESQRKILIGNDSKKYR